MKIEIKPYELKLINPFGIARSTRTVNRIMFLEAGGEFIGEASPSAYYKEDYDNIMQVIEKTINEVSPEDYLSIDWIMTGINSKLPQEGTGSARAAIDTMLHDYAAKKAGMPLYKFLGLKKPEKKQTSFTIGIDTMEVMLKKVADAAEHPILKIKLGRDFKQDILVMKEIRKMSNQTIRVDANGGWSPEEALLCLNDLADLGVEYVEQPLVRGSHEALKKLKHESPLPIFLDEDIHDSRDILKAVDCCHGINIKLMKCGGIHEAMRMVSIAKLVDLQIMLGCMIESSVAITAAAHLSSVIDYLDLDGNLLVSNDPYKGMILEGKEKYIKLPETPGLGIEPANCC